MVKRRSDFTREAQVVVAIRRLMSRGSPLSIARVVDEIRHAEAEQGIPPFGESADRTVGAVLRSLEAAGLLTRRDDGQLVRSSSGPDLFESTDRDDSLGEVGSEESAALGDNNPPPPPRPPGGAGGDSGNAAPGDGYREVLSHPHLFALPVDRFQELLQTIGEPS